MRLEPATCGGRSGRAVLVEERLDAAACDRIAEVSRHYPGTALVVVTGDTDAPAAARLTAGGVAVVGPEGERAAFTSVLGPVHGRPDPRPRPEPAAAGPVLSPREQEVLAMLADGRNPTSIARALGITLHTARGHVKAIRVKLDCTSALEAVVRAARLGLLDVRL